jgi:lysozyme
MRLRRWTPAVLALCLACGGPDESERKWGTLLQALCVNPAGPTIDGSDVSSYQGTISWSQVSGSSFGNFAYAKATEGEGYTDPDFPTNWPAMKTAGVPRGAYHFYHCVTDMSAPEDPTTEANDFVGAINSAGGLVDGDLPPMLDMEAATRTDPNGNTINDCTASNISDVLTWLQVVQSSTGRQPVVYTYPSFLSGSLPAGLANYPLWIANYTSASCPDVPSPWSNWVIWQYSSTTNVPGENCGTPPNCDVDHYNGDVNSLHNWLYPDGGAVGADSGSVVDSGGVADAASEVDSGTPSDAGSVSDAGSASDAGSRSPDSGSIPKADAGEPTVPGPLTPKSASCGCASAGSSASAWFCLAIALLAKRRRHGARGR